MKGKTTTRRLDVLGTSPTDREIFSAVLKQWLQRLCYCSLAAAIPAVLATPLAESRSEEAKKPDAGVTEQSPMRQR